MTRIAVLGAGSWGSTFALVLADAGCEVTLWARREETARAIRETHRNPEYLGEVQLPAAVTASADVAQALEGADGVVLALPTQRLRENLSDWRRAGIELPPVPVLSLAKGIERGTDQRMSQVIAEAGGVDPARIAVLSGPNLALEIAARQPSGSVIAAADESIAHTVARWCAAPAARPDTASSSAQHPVGLAGERIAGDPPVEQAHHAVAAGGDLFVVGDHHQGLAFGDGAGKDEDDASDASEGDTASDISG